jgi:protein SCO1/2
MNDSQQSEKKASAKTSAGASHDKILWLVLGLALVVLLIVFYAFPQLIGKQDNPTSVTSAGVIPQPRALNDFSLTDHNNKPFTRASFNKQWTLLFFGYTNCPDICPQTMTTFKLLALEIRKNKKLSQDTRFVFVSVDPERDTIKRLATWIRHYDPEFTAVTGNNDQLGALSKSLAAYFKVEKNHPKGYKVAHSPYIFVIGPDAKWHVYYRSPHSAKLILKHYRNYRAKSL